MIRMIIVLFGLVITIGACEGDSAKGGALCDSDADCENDFCEKGICNQPCESDDECAEEAYCSDWDNYTEYCKRPCSAGCGDKSDCIRELGVCG